MRHGNGLSRDVVESPSLDVLQRHIEVVLKDLVSW